MGNDCWNLFYMFGGVKIMLIKFDDELKGGLDQLISGMLPHSDYEPKLFYEIYSNIIRYIKIEEMSLEYRVLFNVFEDCIKIFNGVSMQDIFIDLDRETLDNILSSSIPAFVENEGYKHKKWFEERQLDSNFNIPTSAEEAMSALYNEVMDLYDRCFELAVPSKSAIGRFIAFKEIFKQSVSESCIQQQIVIVREKLWYNGRYYKGYDSWLEYVKEVSSEMTNRLDDNLNTTSEALDDVTKIEDMFKKARESYKPLAPYNAEPFDDLSPITAHTLEVLAGNSNAGKTMYVCYLASNIIACGRKVLFMCGESAPVEISARILSSLIYKWYGRFVSAKQILGKIPCDEEGQKIINLASIRLAKEGNLVTREAYSYEGFDDDVVADYEKYKMDALIIDHSLTLKRSKNFREATQCVDSLALSCRDLKRKYPLYILVTSHLSVAAQEDLAKTGIIRASCPYVTKNSSTLHGEADEIKVIYSNEVLEKKSIRGFIVVKTRNGGKDYNTVYLKALFTANEWQYDTAYQEGGSDSMDVAQAYDEIEKTYIPQEEEGFLIDFDNDDEI